MIQYIVGNNNDEYVAKFFTCIKDRNGYKIKTRHVGSW